MPPGAGTSNATSPEIQTDINNDGEAHTETLFVAANVTQKNCDWIAQRPNNRPRKRHGYLTPAELYEENLCCTSNLILAGSV